MKKKKLKVEKKAKEVERIKCDDCGEIGEEEEINTVVCDPDLIEVRSSSYGEQTERSKGWNRRNFGTFMSGSEKGLKFSQDGTSTSVTSVWMNFWTTLKRMR